MGGGRGQRGVAREQGRAQGFGEGDVGRVVCCHVVAESQIRVRNSATRDAAGVFESTSRRAEASTTITGVPAPLSRPCWAEHE